MYYYQRRWRRTASSLARGTNTGRRGKRWEANTVALIKPSRLSLAAQEGKKAKEKLLAAIYLRALTDPYSFRDRRRSVEGLNACWSRSRLRFLFHETPRPCDRDGRSCFIRKAFLDEGEKGLLEARETSSSPIVSFFICARNTPSPFFSLLFRISNTRKAGRLKKKVFVLVALFLLAVLPLSAWSFLLETKAFSLIFSALALSTPRKSFVIRRGTRNAVCSSRILKACSPLRVNSRWGFTRLSNNGARRSTSMG